MLSRPFADQLEGVHLQWFGDEGTATSALTDTGDATPADVTTPQPDQGEVNQPKAEGWKATLRPDQQNHELASKFKKNPEFFDDYVGLHEKLKGAVVIPGEGATPEDWDNYFRSMGRPDSPDGYQLSGGRVASEEFTGWYKQQAHKLGLSGPQAEKLFTELESYSENLQAEELSAQTRGREKSMNTLRTEYGEDFDESIAGARRIIQKFGGEEAAALLNEEVGGKKVGDDPRLIRMFLNVYKAVAEDKLLPGDVRGDRPRGPGEYRYPDM